MAVDAVRTPDQLTEGLVDFPFQSTYREFGGLRLAHLDEGEGAPVVFMHGEPTWSYLWRRVFPPVVEAGYRAIVPDHAGFGRSDKPVDVGWYSYDRHVEYTGSLFEALDLSDVTMVVHDWGGPIGLRIAVEMRERVSKIVIMDTGLFTGRQHMSEAWIAFRDFVQRTEDLPVSFLVRGACKNDPGDDVAAAYDAPYPDVRSKAGARAFPLMLPTSPEMAGGAAGQAILDAFAAGDDRPKLVLWADSDPVLDLETGRRFAAAVGAPAPEVIPDASHFLQEDQGPLLGARIAEWLTSGA